MIGCCIKIGNVLSITSLAKTILILRVNRISRMRPERPKHYQLQDSRAGVQISGRHACILTKYAMHAVSCCVQECSCRLWTGCTWGADSDRRLPVLYCAVLYRRLPVLCRQEKVARSCARVVRSQERSESFFSSVQFCVCTWGNPTKSNPSNLKWQLDDLKWVDSQENRIVIYSIPLNWVTALWINLCQIQMI